MEYKKEHLTKYSEPEAWLCSTYPQLHAMWRVVMSNKDIMDTHTMKLTCTICKVKPSSGLHYGVKICEADKQFLKRTFHHQIKYPQCSKPGESVCPPRPRGWCQLCRLTTCLTVPINIAMIRVDKKPIAMKGKKIIDQNPISFEITIQPNQEFQIPEVIPSWSATPPPHSAMFQYLPPAPLIPYSTPSITQVYGSYNIDQELLLSDHAVPDQDSAPLDLSIKSKPKVVECDGLEELFLIDSPTKKLVDQLKEDLTKSSLSGKIFPRSRPSSPLYFDVYSKMPSLSRPSSADGRTRSTPSSSVLEVSYGLNKLSVNSTALGEALAQIQANISGSSLANLSSVSDILCDEEK